MFLRIKKEGGKDRGCLFLVVHLADHLLAFGIACAGGLPIRVAHIVAIPASGNRRPWRFRFIACDLVPASACSARASRDLGFQRKSSLVTSG